MRGIFIIFILGLSLLRVNSEPLTIRIISGDLFHSDQNQCNQNIGPRAVYVAIEICNNSVTTYNNVSITLSGFSSVGFSLAGNQTATLLVKSPFLPSACDTLFWFCTYPCGVSSTDIFFNISDQDNTVNFNDTLTSISSLRELSANAGGFVYASTSTLRDSINSIECFTVTYGFSQLKAGDKVFIQPIANLSFNAQCFQLESAEVISSEANSPGCIPVGPSSLYYSITENCGSSPDWIVVVSYCFKVKCPWTTTTVIPYASCTSGKDLKYTIANTSIVMSVSFGKFTGQQINNTIQLNWNTLSEINSQHFIVEKLINREWIALHTIPAAGWSDYTIDYQYTDPTPESEINYYRLKQVDLDQSFTYSKPIAVRYDPAYADIKYYDLFGRQVDSIYSGNTYIKIVNGIPQKIFVKF